MLSRIPFEPILNFLYLFIWANGSTGNRPNGKFFSRALAYSSRHTAPCRIYRVQCNQNPYENVTHNISCWETLWFAMAAGTRSSLFDVDWIIVIPFLSHRWLNNNNKKPLASRQREAKEKMLYVRTVPAYYPYYYLRIVDVDLNLHIEF